MWIESAVLGHFFLSCNLLWPCSQKLINKCWSIYNAFSLLAGSSPVFTASWPWPNGLTSRPQVDALVFKTRTCVRTCGIACSHSWLEINLCRLSLGDETVKNLRRSTLRMNFSELNHSQRKSSQVNASGWPNATQVERKLCLLAAGFLCHICAQVYEFLTLASASGSQPSQRYFIYIFYCHRNYFNPKRSGGQFYKIDYSWFRAVF